MRRRRPIIDLSLVGSIYHCGKHKVILYPNSGEDNLNGGCSLSR
jgi:hypothetical protein